MSVQVDRSDANGKASPALGAFGEHLRSWRRRRGMSQLDLALAAGSTSRYVSFIETRPGRELVLRLAQALDVSLRDTNSMLVAAGLRPEFPERPLDEEQLRPVRELIATMLERHDPYPAWCWGSGLRLIACNRGAQALFPDLNQRSPMEIVEYFYGSSEFRDGVENWRRVLQAGLAALRKDYHRNNSPELRPLLERATELMRDIDVADTDPDHSPPVAGPIFDIEGQRIRVMSTVMRFDNARDLTVADLKVELMFPVDEASASFLKSKAGR
ncbi:MAG: helix-turn-helix domain-containing protein [Myxococcota bacterium]